MAYKGPAGLLGKPENTESFTPFKVKGEDITCWIHDEAMEFFRERGSMPDGSYLFVVEGIGRLRLWFEDETEGAEESPSD
ncbi:MAG: trimethylamine--corrinoid methyltransferase [Thermovirgaceae bacterium]